MVKFGHFDHLCVKSFLKVVNNQANLNPTHLYLQ